MGGYRTWSWEGTIYQDLERGLHQIIKKLDDKEERLTPEAVWHNAEYHDPFSAMQTQELH